MSSSEYEQSDGTDSDDDRKDNEKLFQAIRDDEFDIFLQLLASVKDTKIIDRNNKGHTLLHYAVDRNRKEIVQELTRPKWEIDINATNEDGNTSLHIAFFRGRKKLIQLLQKAGAKTGIKNSNGKIASELGKYQKNITPSAHSQVGPSGQQQPQRKRKISDFDNTRSNKLRILQGSKRLNDEERKLPNYITKKLKLSEEYSASGLKSTLHGVSYQLKLLMLFLKRGVEQGFSFRLATEMDAAEKFDDLVFQYGEGNKMVHRFLQAKHKQDQASKISVNDLLTQTNANFSLQKYFLSYRKIKDKLEFNSKNNEIRDLIICTNIGMKYGDKRGSLTLSDNIFDEERDESILKTDLLRFKKDFVGKEEVVSVLKNAPDLVKLAKKLVDCALNGESAENIKSKKDATDNLFKSYQFALVKEVIDGDRKILRPEFVTNAQHLSPRAKHFRKAFEDAFHDRRKTYNLNSDPFIKVKDLDKFVQEIATLIQNAGGSEEIRVERRKTVMKDNFDKLAGYVLVKKKSEIRFSSAFLNSSKLPGNLNSFRKRLLDELSKKKIKFNNLVQYKIKIKDFKTCDEIYVDKNTFWESVKDKKLELFDNFGKWDANLESVQEFVIDLANLIQESRNNGEKHVEIKEENKKMSKNIHKLAKHALTETNGKIYFNREFLEDTVLPDNLNEFRDQLEAEVDDLGELRFVVNNLPRSSLPSDSITDIDTDIQTFLNKLVFAVNQPKEIELGDTIDAELGECRDINLIDSEFLASNFEKFIFDWMKEKKGRFLTYIDGKNFFDEMKMKLASLKLTGLTLEYRFHMKQTNIRFSNDEIELQQFLEPENRAQLFILISTPDTILGLIKVHQTIVKIPEYEKDDSYIFIRLNSFLRMQDPVADAFGSRRKHLLIIECKSLKDTEQSCEECNFFEAIKSDNRRKIILITDKNNTLANKLKRMFGKRYLEKEIEVNSLLDLEGESRSKIMKERKVNFQGQEVSLSDLINEESMNLVDAKTLSKLIDHNIPEIAKPLQDLGVVKEYYIPRQFKRWEKINQTFEYAESKFYVHSFGPFEDSGILHDQDIVLISDNNKHFKELKDEKKYKRHNTHWLKLEHSEYIWQESKGALSKLRDYVDKREESITTYAPTKVNDITKKLVIIAAEPGMGKSTVLTNLALETKAFEPTSWIATINLSMDCSTVLKTLTSKRIEINEEETIEFLIATTNLEPGLQQEFFKDCYKRGKMALLFDGFDEISPNYTDKVIELLKFLKETKVEKIWVTTRPYNIKNDLEDELGLFSYVLKEFSKDDQRRFLKKFWTAHLQLVNFDDERAEVFIDVLLDSFSKMINDPDRKFISIPLQIGMVAEVCKDTFAEFYESVNYALSDDQKRKIEKNLDLINLYENFFKIKFDDICFGEKRPTWDGAVPDNIRLQNKERNYVMEDHKKLAMLNIYGNNWVEKLLPGIEKKNLLEDVKRSENKSGIIDRVVDGKPIFVHQSFAEYFAALWFSEKLHDQEKENIVKEFLREHIFQDESRVIRNFLDRILSKDKSNDNQYKIHIAVLNNNVREVDSLLDTDVSLLEKFDHAGRTPLHLAAAYGHTEVAESLLRAARKHENLHILRKKDKLFDWSALSYADKNSHWNVVELLLQIGADGDDMFEALRSMGLNMEVENVNAALLHTAAEEADREMLEYSENKRTKSCNEKENMPLHDAARQGHLEIIKYLVGERNADFEAVDAEGSTPMHKATSGGHLEIIKYLIDKKNANFDAIDKKRRTPLHKAASEGHLEVIKYLIDVKDANFEAGDEDEGTLLHNAASAGHLEIIQYLVDEKKANFGAVDTKGRTPLHKAASGGHLGIIKYLVNEKDANIDAIESRGRTILHKAAWYGHLEIVEYLVNERNANFDAVDAEGITTLHIAAWQGQLEIIKFLVDEKNANFEVVDVRKETLLHLAAWHGHLEIIKYLVDEKNANFEAVDAEGITPLHIAAWQNHLKIIEYLVSEKNSNYEAVDLEEKTPLHRAAWQGYLEIIQFLVDEKNANVHALDNEGETPLHKAAWQGHMKIIKYLVNDKNANFQAVDENGETPMHFAASQGHLEVIRYLVDEKNANFDAVDNQGETLLHNAAWQGHLGIVKYLVDGKKANFNVISKRGETPLHKAAWHGHLEIIKYLVDKKNANFEAVEVQGETLVHFAAWQGHLEIMKYLVDEKNANYEGFNEEGETPLHKAASQGHLEVIRYLVDEKNANFDTLDNEGETPLHNAASQGHLEIIKYLVDGKGADFNVVSKERETPLHKATRHGHLEIIEYLVDEKNAIFDAINAEGITPLHIAAWQGHLKIVQYLVDEKNANCDAVDVEGMTPLHIAAWQDHLEMMKYLVNTKNANFDAVDEEGKTPLHNAAWLGHQEIIKYLVGEKNANFNVVDKDGETPLHKAAWQGHLEIIEYFLDEKNANFDAIDSNGRTILHMAAWQGHVEIVKYLVDEKNANSDAEDAEGTTPLHLAAWQGHLAVIEYLINEKHANSEVVDKKGETPLHKAAWQGHLEIMKYLIDEKNVNFDSVDTKGRTALHKAAAAGHLESIKYLVDVKNADSAAVDITGITPLHIATWQGHLEVIKYLIDEKNTDFNTVDHEGEMSLHKAAWQGHLDILKYLVDEKNSDLDAVDKEERTPLHNAVWGGHLEIIKYLVDEKNANLHAIDLTGKSILHKAAWQGQLEIIKYLVDEKNVNLEVVDVEGSTSLHIAAWHGHHEIIKYLVDERNANIDAVDKEGETPLYKAAQQGHLDIIKYLINKKNANLEAVDKNLN